MIPHVDNPQDVNIRTNAVVGVDTSSSNVKFQGTVGSFSVVLILTP